MIMSTLGSGQLGPHDEMDGSGVYQESPAGTHQDPPPFPKEAAARPAHALAPVAPPVPFCKVLDETGTNPD